MYPATHAKSTPDKPAYVMARQRRGGDLPRARRAVEPLRAAVPRARPAGRATASRYAWRTTRASSRSPGRRSDRVCTTRRSARVCDRSRGRVHRRRLRRQGVHHLRVQARDGAELRDRLAERLARASCSTRAMPGYESYEEAVAGQPGRRPWPRSSKGRTCSTRPARPGARRASSSRSPASPPGTPPALLQLMTFLYGADRRQRLPVAGAALPRRADALLHGHASPRRHDGGHGEVRSARDLRLIEQLPRHAHPVVPTMFVRMLKLPEEERSRYDLSSLRVAIHAAAPCPIPVKEQMIEWWGPVLYEYYAGTEGNGFTAIDSHGMAGAPGLGRARRCSARSTSSTRTATSCRRARSAPSTSPAVPRSSTTTIPRRRPESRNDQGLVDARRHRLPRRRRLPLPHRPQGLHDHLRRREHLPAGGGERAGHCTPRWRTSPSSACPTRTSARR